MRTALGIALALMLAIPQTSFTEGISQDNSGMDKTAIFEWTGDRGVDQPAALSPEDECWAFWQGTISGVANGWYTGGEYFATYQDPSETGCTNTYPFNVTEVQLVFRNPAGGVGNLTTPMQAVVYSVDLSNPTCPRPGVVLGRGALTPFNIGDNSWKTAQLTVDVCVNGPYFAGVYCPERIGGSSLDPGISSPAASPFGLRACASYNNYQGSWEDLVTEHGWVGNLVLISGGYSSNENSCVECPTVIPEGYDLWQSSRDGVISLVYPFFMLTPLPPDFFGPGSDPFDGIITDLQGQPLETEPPGILGQTDMIIRRHDPITIPAPGSPPQTIDIEIVALNLVNLVPIEVTYNGGQTPEYWNVRVCLSNSLPSTNTMDIESWCCDGGVWDWHQPNVNPLFTFSRQSDGSSVSFDAAANGYSSLLIDTREGRWSAAIDPPDIPGMVVSEGLVLVDHDCNPGTAEIELGQSSRFVLTGGLGEPWFPEPCTDDYCPVSNTTGDEYISRVQIGSIDNVTGASSYSDYYGTQATTMAADIGCSFTITGTNTGGSDRWNMWIDWNNDFDFFDAGEEVDMFAGAGPYTGTITPPHWSGGGSYRLRVRMNSGPVAACGEETVDGEAEDYRIDVLPDVCDASGSCDDVYIDRIDDAAGGPVIMMSECDYYSDFFDQTHIILPKTLLINNPIPAPAFVGVWVDWNQDNDFDDASETFWATDQGEPGPRYHFAPLTKPAGTPSGEYRLRIAIDRFDLPEPCGSFSGEVEDYKVVVSGCCEGRVGDANGTGEYPDEVSLADIMLMVDVLFISNVCTKLPCPDEADVNQSGGPNPPQEACMDYLSLGDIMTLVDFLFITGPQNMTLPDCL